MRQKTLNNLDLGAYSLGCYGLGSYGLGGYSSDLPVLDLGDHSPAGRLQSGRLLSHPLEGIYRTLQPKCCLGKQNDRLQQPRERKTQSIFPYIIVYVCMCVHTHTRVRMRVRVRVHKCV